MTLEFFVAVCKGDREKVNICLQQGVDPRFVLSKIGNFDITCSSVAVFNGDQETIALLKRKLDPVSSYDSMRSANHYHKEFESFIRSNNLTISPKKGESFDSIRQKLPNLEELEAEELLLEAYKFGYLKFAEKLFEKLERFYPDFYDWTELCHASFIGDICKVKELSSFGLHFKRQVKGGISAIDCAVMGGSIEVLEYFCNKDSWYGIFRGACRYNQAQLLTYLEQKASFSDYEQKEILEYAIKMHNLSLLQKVLDKASQTSYKYLVPYICRDSGDISLLSQYLPNVKKLATAQMLLKYFDGEITKKDHFESIIKCGSIELLRYFFVDLGHGVNFTNHERNNVLMIAVGYMKPEFVKKLTSLLIELGGSLHHVNEKLQTVLMFVVERLQKNQEWLDVLKFMKEKGANIHVIDREGNNLLLLSCKHSSVNNALVEYLVEQGVEVNQPSLAGESALSELVAHSHDISSVKTLVMNGANINHVNAKGESILTLVAKSGCFDVFKLLVEHGANTSFVTFDGSSILDVLVGAVESNHQALSTLEFLFTCEQIQQHLIKDHIKSIKTLHIFVRNGWVNLSKILLSCGVNVDYVDSAGQTIIDAAIANNEAKSKIVLGILLNHQSVREKLRGDQEKAAKVLHTCVKCGWASLVPEIVTMVDVNVVYQGKPALFVAVEQVKNDKDLKTVTYLLSHGANPQIMIETPNRTTITVLRYALENKSTNKKLLRILLESDLDLKAENSFQELEVGLSVFKLASTYGITNLKSRYCDKFENGIILTNQDDTRYFSLELVNNKDNMKQYLKWGFNPSDGSSQKLVMRYVTIGNSLCADDVRSSKGLESAFNFLYKSNLQIGDYKSLFSEEENLGSYMNFVDRVSGAFTFCGFKGKGNYGVINRQVIGNLEKIFSKFIISEFAEDGTLIKRALIMLNKDLINSIMKFYIFEEDVESTPSAYELDYLTKLCEKYSDVVNLSGQNIDFTVDVE
jgi:ankyrin repeat protein